MGLGKGVLMTCSCSSLTDVRTCPFKLQVVTVVLGQNEGIFVVWNINDRFSVFLLLNCLVSKKKIRFVLSLIRWFIQKNVFTTCNINGRITTVIFSNTAGLLMGIT